MAKTYILYNQKAGNGQHLEHLDGLELVLEAPIEMLEISRITSYAAFFRGLEPEDHVVIAGGDGTLNQFINDTEGLEIRQELLYYPIGSGNDFAHDVGKTSVQPPFKLREYMRNLPTVRVNGKTYRFINGVGYGIDGYCCEVGDELRKKPGKKVNYTAIAIKGLLLHYKPTRAWVTVDGVAHEYDKVWLVPTMHGRYYGGGMMPTPKQDRLGERRLSAMVFHGSGRLKTLMVFPSIFKGEHVRHQEMVEILEGKEITVEFDRPTALQIDGETITGVTSYTAIA